MPASHQPAEPVRIGIATVSDRASQGVYQDRSGPAIRDYLTAALVTHVAILTRVVPDEQPRIERAIIELADEQGCSLILTTGGTGPALRDVTPEATVAVCEKMMPGFGEQMRRVSLQYVPTAILSRQTAGVRGRCLVINLPGQPKAIAECLDAVFPAVPYCLELLGAPYLQTDETKVVAFRPKPAKPPGT